MDKGKSQIKTDLTVNLIRFMLMTLYVLGMYIDTIAVS